MEPEDQKERVTQRTVALNLGITQATVSLALRNDPRIPEARRKEIQAAAEAMGYQPSPAASALAQLRHTSKVKPRHAAVAWLNFWRDSPALRNHREIELYFQGASDAAEKFGFHLEEFRCGEGMTMSRIESILVNRGIEGILLPPHRRAIEWDGFNWNRFSVIKFGRSLEEPHVQIVTSDHVYNSVLAFRKIRAKGYRRIGFVDSDVKYWLFDAGVLKVQCEFEEAERVPIITLERTPSPLGSAAYKNELKRLKEWLRREKPDAIYTTSNRLVSLLNEIGVRVPEDIPVAGASLFDCQVDAGVDQNAREIGRVATLSLISLLHDNDRGLPELYRETLVKGKWVDGSAMPDK